ncbi:MAG: hypothetical protein HOO86_17000 [Bacteroidales bacterium]|nr:hypothetical protein [Bacteroidales bacterium]
MKSLYLFLICIFIVLQSYSQSIRSEFGKDIVSEIQVKSIHEIVSKSAVDPDGSGTPVIVSETISEFDFLGKVLQITVLKKGIQFSRLVFEYDSLDVPIRATDYNNDGSIYLSIQYKFDENGFINEEIYNREAQKSYGDERKSIDIEYFKYYQGLFTRMIIKNDFMGRVLEQTYLKENGDLSFKYSYEYDYLGNCTSTKYFNDKGSLSWQTKYQYDALGRRKVKKLFKNNYMVQTTKYSYEIDENKNWVSRTAKTKVINNIYNQLLHDETEITRRTILYY